MASLFGTSVAATRRSLSHASLALRDSVRSWHAQRACGRSGDAFAYRVQRTLLTSAVSHGPTEKVHGMILPSMCCDYLLRKYEPALEEGTIGQYFESIVKKHGHRTAVISEHQGRSLTYTELDRQSNSIARGLLEFGVGKGQRVAVSLGNNIEYAVLTYALFKLGAILVPLNPAFNAPQVISALNHLSASHLVIGTETHLSYRPARSNLPLLNQILPEPSVQSKELASAAVPSLKSVVLVENGHGEVDNNLFSAVKSWEHLTQRKGSNGTEQALPSQDLDANDIINIQFTSGTTSTPKAACLTHRNILNNGKSIGDRLLLTPDDIICCPPPLFHCFGCILGYMAVITHGAAIVFPSEAFDAMATLDAVKNRKCTGLYGVPTMFEAELDLISSGRFPPQETGSKPCTPTPFSFPADAPSASPVFPHDSSSTSKPQPSTSKSSTLFPHLRTGIAAGSPIAPHLMQRLHRDLNLHDLAICYGMTETSPVSCMTTTSDAISRRLDSVGKALPHVSVKIVSPTDPCTTLPINHRGELAVSGYLVMSRYWNDEARTRETMSVDADGTVWMHTGDEATIDAEGYVRITGRIKDLIIRGGENVHPLEIENCLCAHRDVAGVAVVGLPDARYGEVVAAFVARAADASGPSPSATEGGMGMMRDSTEAEGDGQGRAELRNWVRERLSAHLVPKYIFFVGGFPKTASGKIQKFKLRELGAELLASRAETRTF